MSSMKGTVTIEVEDFLRLKKIEEQQLDIDQKTEKYKQELNSIRERFNIERFEIAQDILTILTEANNYHKSYDNSIMEMMLRINRNERLKQLILQRITV